MVTRSLANANSFLGSLAIVLFLDDRHRFYYEEHLIKQHNIDLLYITLPEKFVAWALLGEESLPFESLHVGVCELLR